MASRPHVARADTLENQHQLRAQVAGDPAATIRGVPDDQALALKISTTTTNTTPAKSTTAVMGQQECDELDRELADAQVAGDEGFDDDDDDDDMDKMSSSPSITDEDIDFEMVYALHHFSATVEGQANASKGEHMVLLDDSNSYWWLVRIVRDSSIGYLPAEHIETPTERLARLNKHRNIDLASNQLGDTGPEKSRNPLKRAVRRRNTKTVAFTEPTYHEASEYDYTTEEEEGGEEEGGLDDDEGGNIEVHGDTSAEKEKAVKAEDKPTRPTISVVTPPIGDPRTSAEMQKRADEIMKATVSPSTLRHPDSAIFNDENQGTKKLTLTPNLLRDDANITSPILKSEIIKGRASLERDKPQGAKREDSVLSPQPNSKDTRRLKKGASVLGNLFKKRARRGRKEDEDDVEEWLHGHGDKPSIDSSMSLELTPKESPGGRDEEARKEREESLLREEQKRQQQQRLRQEEQKRQEQIQQEQIQQEKLKQEQLKEQQEQLKQEQLQQEQAQRQQEQQQEQQLQDQRQQDYQQHQQEHREREHREREQREREAQSASVTSAAIRNLESETTQEPASLTRNQLSSAISILPDALRPGPDQAKTRSYGQPIDTRSQMQQGKTPESVKNQVYSPKAYQATTAALVDRSVERLSESPEQITFHDASERPDLVIDTSSGAESNDAGSPINSSPEMIERSSTFETANTSLNPIDTALRGHAMTRTWSDWSLRTYFEDDNDVRDMLIVVQQDKGNVVQQKQHPDISPIFADSTKRLADITRQLDNMLGDWLQRRGAR